MSPLVDSLSAPLRASLLGSVIAVIGLAPGWSNAVELGQVDNFEDDTTQGWGVWPFFILDPPVNVPGGGPGGLGDGFLLVQGNGSSAYPEGSPTAANDLQWFGNYAAAGIGGISADVKNFSDVPLSVRLVLSENNFEELDLRFLSGAVDIPARSGWVRAFWPTSPEDLISVGSAPGDPATALDHIAELRMIHNPGFCVPGVAAAVQLGLDNIRAETPALPDGDRDHDGIPDASDNCPFFASSDQTDTNQDGRGNACECGDQNGDGHVSVLDIVAINTAIFNPTLRSPLCDTNRDCSCTVRDIVGARNEIFSPVPTSICGRQPIPGP